LAEMAQIINHQIDVLLRNVRYDRRGPITPYANSTPQ
jgi:hypothetical protein